ncbi:glycosyl hydrolase family 43 [Pedobacter changchengzhani]|uniref:Glycosyl hydrolase family 43 n=1 Tax=Pedobacter changchengzhani TaxID=2529274 RepID=A0A4R5MN86_9SPHI|nr:glycoside hydrolase family 43 protein [Pedobacter changchengzhani]TDG37271.1 glycosyl hydrolase family 43 [Pedobacter changchengzhani]
MMYKQNFKPSLLALLIPIGLMIGCGKGGDSPSTPIKPPVVQNDQFINPVIAGADPYVYQKDGTYYFMVTTGNSIKLSATKKMSEISNAVPLTVFTPTTGDPNSKNIWAPEINFLDGKWYIYYTAGNGDDKTQRTWVLENSNADPMQGSWVSKGKLSTADTDFWAIDGDIMEYNGSRYFLWSGRPDVTNIDKTQNIYIAKMTNPYTLEGNATMLSTPQFGWEKNGFGVNEGPQFLANGNKAFIVYSASYCGTDDYALGLLTLKANGNPLVLADWTKTAQPIFAKNPSANAYAPGHNSFFKSPDGTQNWIIYHANTLAGQGCGTNRNVRMQQFTFNVDGSPNFGTPVATGLKVTKPSGE